MASQLSCKGVESLLPTYGKAEPLVRSEFQSLPRLHCSLATSSFMSRTPNAFQCAEPWVW